MYIDTVFLAEVSGEFLHRLLSTGCED
ncbi:hypothetical protein AGR7B_Lc60052 [Agrobacterium deltaense RV3]|nr:hypothetical protein AGR7B_Lc60052 [Agrobacterium deltaense RV3]